MSGGGSTSIKKTDKKKDEPAAPTPGPTVPAFMPGMDNMLAQQLAAGGYGNPSDLLDYFQKIYSPMTMPGSNVVQGGPAVGSGSGGSGGDAIDPNMNGWSHGRFYKDGQLLATAHPLGR